MFVGIVPDRFRGCLVARLTRPRSAMAGGARTSLFFLFLHHAWTSWIPCSSALVTLVGLCFCIVRSCLSKRSLVTLFPCFSHVFKACGLCLSTLCFSLHSCAISLFSSMFPGTKFAAREYSMRGCACQKVDRSPGSHHDVAVDSLFCRLIFKFLCRCLSVSGGCELLDDIKQNCLFSNLSSLHASLRLGGYMLRCLVSQLERECVRPVLH